MKFRKVLLDGAGYTQDEQWRLVPVNPEGDQLVAGSLLETPFIKGTTNYAGAVYRAMVKASPVTQPFAYEFPEDLGDLEMPPEAFIPANAASTPAAQWRDDALKTLQPASVHREMTLLASVIEIARREWGWLKESPLKDVKKPTKPPHRDRLISSDEAERLISALGYYEGLPIETKQQQIAIAFLFALETAMRAGEIVELTWDRVSLQKRFVSLAETKNGDSRNVPLSNRAVELLQKLQGLDKQRVFTVDSGSLSTLFRRARDNAKIEDLHFHDTRHQAITTLAKKLTVIQLARMVGHRDLKSLMIYYNETASELAELLN